MEIEWSEEEMAGAQARLTNGVGTHENGDGVGQPEVITLGTPTPEPVEERPVESATTSPTTDTTGEEDSLGVKRTARKSIAHLAKNGGSVTARTSLEDIVHGLTCETGPHFGMGVTSRQLMEHTMTLPETDRPNRSRNHLQVLLTRAVEKGKLVRLAPSLYTTAALTAQHPDIYQNQKAVEKRELEEELTPPLSPEEDAFLGLGLISKTESERKRTVATRSSVDAEVGESGRPARKRVKKVLGPEFVDFTTSGASQEKKEEKKEENKERKTRVTCERCGLGQTSMSQKLEPFISCSVCPKKWHPSCLGYSDELSLKCRKSSTWQCIDCKTCQVCNEAEDSDDPDSFLLCDECDDAMHMRCTDPPMEEKPGEDEEWFCSRCTNLKAEKHFKKKSHKRKPGPKPKEVKEAMARFGGAPVDRIVGPLKHEKPLLPDLSRDEIFRAAGEEVVEWSSTNVRDFIAAIGFREESKTFYEQDIDGQALLLLKRADVISRLALKLGPALKLFRRIYALQMVYEQHSPGPFKDVNQNGIPFRGDSVASQC